jgi:5-formyltetrahydrofolate cyclo-ligase
MIPIKDKKQLLRKEYLQKRSWLEKYEVKEKSKLICENFINNLLPSLVKFKPDAVFSIYISSRNEVNTLPIIEYFIEKKINFCYPVIIQKDCELRFVKHYDGQLFKASKIFKNILEPENGKEVIPDYIIMPLLAFDKKRNRLGMGGGFFDRTIDKFNKVGKKFISIGIAYDLQRYNGELPTEKTDQSLDFIACEKDIFC